MKKICIVTTVESSIKNWFYPIFDDYAKLDVDVTVVCNMSEEYQQFLKETYPAVHTKSLPFPRGISLLGSLKSIALLRRFLKEQHFDYIQYHTPNAALYGSIAGKMCKIPIRVYGQWGIRYASVSGIKRHILKSLEKITCKASTHIHAQSPKNMRLNITEGLCKPEKISVIGIGGTIGVDFQEFDITQKDNYREEVRKQYGLSDSDFLFGFIGRIHKDKGINELTEAFGTIQGAKLMVIGDYDKNYPPKEENWAKIQDSPDIIYVDRIPRAEVGKYLSAMDVFAYPTYREGFGHILQEAMTMGIPVITTDIPGPSEVVEDGISGTLVPVRNVERLGEAMNELMSDVDKRELFSKNGRKRAEQYFEKSIMVGHIMDDYKETLQL